MTAPEHPVLQLKDRADKRLRGGHCWIYSNEVDTAKTPLGAFSPGDLVQVRDAAQRPLGVAYVNPHTLICARLLSRRPEQPIDVGFFRTRIRQALMWRERCYAEPFYRLVYGEGDGLPGLVVDRFGDVLVAQSGSAGIERQQQAVVDALVSELKPAGILLRNTSGVRELEGLEALTEVVYGKVPDAVELVENGARFRAPVMTGQKTGWFYDHRQNRAQLQRWASGRRVLDVFGYIGGWGVEALIAGARETVLIDSSAPALAMAIENARYNGCEDRMATLHGQAQDVMRELIAAGEKYDVVVLDPPAFIKKRKDLKAGEQGYRRINDLAMRLVSAGGLLVTASCSLHLSRDALTEIVRAVSRHIDREAQIVARGGLSADHPVPPAVPEVDYLKTLFCRVLPVG